MQGNRVKQLLEALKLSQTDFSKEFGIGISTLNEVIRGKTKSLSPEILEALHVKKNVNLNWILSGQGEMFTSETSKPLNDLPSVQTPVILEPISNEVCFKLINALPDSDQKDIRSYVGWRATVRGISIVEKVNKKVKEALAGYHSDSAASTEIPLLGQIAAGNPIFADSNIEQVIRLPQGIVKPRGRRLFAVRVRGDSMIGAGILNGDYALLREIEAPRDEVASGDIVAAVIGSEATLKRAYFEDHQIILKAENPAFEPITCNQTDNCRVVGALVLTWRWWEK